MEETAKLDTLQLVELAEGMEIRLRMAGPVLRAFAYVIDMIIRSLVLIAFSIILSIAGIAIGGHVTMGLILLVWFLMDWFYPVLFEVSRRGATPGKRMMGLRVVQESGSPITWGQAIIRNFLRFVDAMPMPTYGFAMVSCLSTKRFQRLGDLAAGTVVVYDRLPPQPRVSAPPPIAAVPVPLKLTSDEVRALSHFRDRAGLWSDGRRAEIADQASVLSGGTGQQGVARLMAMAHWLQEKRQGRPVKPPGLKASLEKKEEVA